MQPFGQGIIEILLLLLKPILKNRISTIHAKKPYLKQFKVF